MEALKFVARGDAIRRRSEVTSTTGTETSGSLVRPVVRRGAKLSENQLAWGPKRPDRDLASQPIVTGPHSTL